MEIEKYLKQLDLSDKEITVYLALLEMGESNATDIAKKAGLSRTTTIYLLEKLHGHQLVEMMQTRSGKHYFAVKPGKILTLLKNKQAKVEEQVRSFEEAIPELNRLYKKYLYEPQVRFFRGRKEIQSIYREMLNSFEDEILYVGSVKEIEEVLGSRFLRQWIQDRINKGIKTRAVRIAAKEVDHDLYKASRELLRNVRYAPIGFEAPSHIQIYGDNVAIITAADENIGVVISSRDIAITMRNWFNELWKVSTK